MIHYQVTMCAVTTGVPLKHWHTCVSCHIEKDPGSPKLHWLRIIHIYDADMNLVLKLLWSRKLICHVKQHSVLREDQCRSRPCQLATDVVLCKSLTYVVTWQNKTEIITFDHDVKSCMTGFCHC